jgi:hypothetical protein
MLVLISKKDNLKFYNKANLNGITFLLFVNTW